MKSRTFPKNKNFLVAFSYASEEKDLVHDIAKEIEKKLGSQEVFFDEWYKQDLAKGINNSDLVLTNIFKSCVLAVICISKSYSDKQWTRIEFNAIRERQLLGNVIGVMPIRVNNGEVEGILSNTIYIDAIKEGPKKTAQLIFERIQKIRSQVSEDSWPIKCPRLKWSIANQSNVRIAFSALLKQKVKQRYLSIQGLSELGKSHITKLMLSDALDLNGLTNLACGRFDFKGTTDIDTEVKAFIKYLNVPEPLVNLRLNERFRYILDELKQNNRVTLLIFDTYEMASRETQDWVEKELLTSIIRNDKLRVVIAGQRVPEQNGMVWERFAFPVIELHPPLLDDWIDFGKQKGVNITREYAEIIYKILHKKGSMLAHIFSDKSLNEN